MAKAQNVSNVSVDTLRRLDVFSGLSATLADQLLQVSSVCQLAARQKLSSIELGPSERYCFVLSGAVAIVLQPEAAELLVPRASSRTAASDVEYIGYLEPGACFSDGFYAVKSAVNRDRIDCVATSATTLLQVESSHLAQLMAVDAAWRRQLSERVFASRNQFLTHQEPARRVVQDFFLRQNHSTSSVIRVGRLDSCLDCNKCQDACGARYGVARMVRGGLQLGRLTFPVVCRNCQDKPCLAACRNNGIILDAANGEVRILDVCTGCGACVRRCPHGAISLIDRLDAAELPASLPLPSQGERSIDNKGFLVQLDDDAREGILQPGSPKKSNRKRRLAVKCDHCAGFSDQACLSACPTGALIEMRTEELFLEPQPDPLTRMRRFSDAPFLSGIKASSLQSLTKGTAHSMMVVVLLLALLGLGVESFLRATLPERSLSSLFAHWFHHGWVITYSSGRGLGHWLGYIGTGGMLACVLYSLRTRVKRFKNFGAQSTWLSLHVWLGFGGATLVTYHSALKLNRWASIACILMWVVVLTGALGRYIYGRVHSAVGLAEFELNALRRKCQALAPMSEHSWAIRVLLGDNSLEARRSPMAVTMLWHEGRDQAALLWLRLLGARLITPPSERRESVRNLARWAASRRHSNYYQSTQAMLRHWNIVHIVLTIAMFVLAGIHIVYGFMYKAV